MAETPDKLPKGWKCLYCSNYVAPPERHGPPRKQRVFHQPKCGKDRNHFTGPECNEYCSDFTLGGDLGFCFWMLHNNRKVIDD